MMNSLSNFYVIDESASRTNARRGGLTPRVEFRMSSNDLSEASRFDFNVLPSPKLLLEKRRDGCRILGCCKLLPEGLSFRKAMIFGEGGGHERDRKAEDEGRGERSVDMLRMLI